MPQSDPDRLAEEIEEILDSERIALLNGNLSEVARLSGAKEGFLDPRSLAKINPTRLKRIKALSTRNQRLLGASLQAVRAVRERLGHLRTGSRQLNTYDRDGTRRSLDTNSSGTLERRA